MNNIQGGFFSYKDFHQSLTRPPVNARVWKGDELTDMRQSLAASEVDWAVSLRELWQRRFASLPGDQRERARQMRFLLYRGFAGDAVSRLLRGLPDD